MGKNRYKDLENDKPEEKNETIINETKPVDIVNEEKQCLELLVMRDNTRLSVIRPLMELCGWDKDTTLTLTEYKEKVNKFLTSSIKSQKI